MGTPKTFGEYMKAERERQGITLRKLAKRLGKHAATISRVEQGEISIPTPDYFMDLVDALNLDITIAVRFLKPYQRIYDSIINATTQKGGGDE
jgi:transcriptional regulator with XRE-family HTH domain